jgi:transcriptional regulator with XRE-family HTH domain
MVPSAKTSKKKPTLGSILRAGRLKAGLTQAEVAEFLGLGSPQSISDWERDRVTSAPVASLKKLVPLFRLDEDEVFSALFEAEMERLEAQLRSEFYTNRKKA